MKMNKEIANKMPKISGQALIGMLLAQMIL
jgi:hypothetical protein